MATDTPHLSAEKWERLLRAFPNDAERLQQAVHAKTKEEFTNAVRSILKEKAAPIAFDELWTDVKTSASPENHEEQQEKHDEAHDKEHPQSKILEQIKDMTMGPLAFLGKPQYLEADHEYHKIQDRLKKNYLKSRNKKRFDYEDTQDLDFLYGSLDDPQKESVALSAEKAFREEAVNNTKMQKNLQRYDKNKAKIQGGFDKDTYVWHTKTLMGEHAEYRKEALKKAYKNAGKKIDASFDQDFASIMKRLKENTWKKFVEENPEKAATYIKKESQNRIEKQKKNKKSDHDDDDFFYLVQAHEARIANLAQGQTSPSSPSIPHTPEVSTTLTSTPPVSTPVGASPVTVTKSLEEQTIDAQFAALKKQRAEKTAQEQGKKSEPPIQQPLQNPQSPPFPRLGSHNPASASYVIPRPTPPAIPTTPPSIQRVSPGANSPSRLSFPVSGYQGRVRPGGASLPFGIRSRSSNPIVSMGQDFMHNQASKFTNRMMGSAGRAAGRMAGQAGKQIAQKLAARALMSPPVLIIIGIILLILLLIIIIVLIVTGTKTETTAPTTIPGLTLSLEGPTQVGNPSEAGDTAFSNIQYTVNASYTGTAAITLSDTIPPNTVFVSASGSYTCSNNTPTCENGAINWELNSNQSLGGAGPPGTPKTYVFTITLKPTADDVAVKNVIVASAIGGTTGPGGGSCPSPEQIAANRKTTPETCEYFNVGVDIFGDITQAQIDQFINTYASSAKVSRDVFVQRTNLIVSKARQIGLNPVLYLGLWKSESGFGEGMGCAPQLGTQKGFEAQLDCSMGLTPKGGARASSCAASKDANSKPCIEMRGIREANANIYGAYPLTYPLATFDDFFEAYGPKSPALAKAEGISNNNNCRHSYNEVVSVAMALNACTVTPASQESVVAPQTPGTSTLAACKFTKGDQNPKDLPYQSPLLLSYFEEVSQKTGVPATVLAGIARVESTTGKYTISNYTDAEIRQMENTATIVQNVDATIPGTQKALCPRSPTGALGIMQIQPSEQILKTMQLANETDRSKFKANAYSSDSVANGAKFIGKTPDSLTIQDYCNPKTSIYLAAGFVLKKMQGKGYGNGTKWESAWNSDKNAFNAAASSYYGCLRYPNCQSGPNSYGDDLWNSFQACKQ